MLVSFPVPATGTLPDNYIRPGYIEYSGMPVSDKEIISQEFPMKTLTMPGATGTQNGKFRRHFHIKFASQVGQGRINPGIMMACAAPEGTPPRRFNYPLISKKQVIAPPCRTEALMLMSPLKLPFYFSYFGCEPCSCAFNTMVCPSTGFDRPQYRSLALQECFKTIHLDGGQGVHPLGCFPLRGSEGVTLKMGK